MQRWSDFWKKEKHDFFEIMKVSTSAFSERFDNHFGTNRNDRILDFGCGPGFFIELQFQKRDSITGVDINSYFVEECRRKFPGVPVFQIPTDPRELQTALSNHFRDEKFHFIVFLSVAQYFSEKGQLATLVILTKRHLTKKGRVVFADIVTPQTSSLTDTIALFRLCLKKGKLLSLARFIRYLLFSDYGKISKRDGLQTYNDDDFVRIAAETGMECQRVDNLTLHPTRANYVFTNPS